MIVKVTRGSNMGGALRYLAADKETVKRESPHVVAGMDRDGEPLTIESIRELADELDAARILSGTTVKGGHVWACSLAFDQHRDGVLTKEQRRAVAEDFMERMDFGDVRWVAVHHGPNAGGHDHVHIVASLVQDGGKRARDWRDLARASKAANGVERDHGFTVIESRELGVGAHGYHGAEVAVAARLHGKGTEPAPEYLERVVRACAIEARDEREFVREVRAHGVKVQVARYEQGSTERVAAYKYSLNGSATYGGGRLARDLTLPRLRQQWGPAVPGAGLDVQAHRAAGQLAAWSIRTEREPGPIARQSRELGRFAQTRAGVPLVLTAAMATALHERLRAANREAELQREQDERERERHRTPGRERDHGIGI